MALHLNLFYRVLKTSSKHPLPYSYIITTKQDNVFTFWMKHKGEMIMKQEMVIISVHVHQINTGWTMTQIKISWFFICQGCAWWSCVVKSRRWGTMWDRQKSEWCLDKNVIIWWSPSYTWSKAEAMSFMSSELHLVLNSLNCVQPSEVFIHASLFPLIS